MSATVTVVGNLTRAPELRYSTSGQATLSLGIADSRKWKNQAGEWSEATSFHNAVVYGQLAENIAESLDKGARVVVTGRLDQRTYETQQGEKRNVVEIVADAVGPDLRFATCVVNRNERAESTNARPGVETYDRGIRQPAGSHTAGVPYDDGEEPFLLDAHVDSVPSRRLFGGIQ